MNVTQVIVLTTGLPVVRAEQDMMRMPLRRKKWANPVKNEFAKANWEKSISRTIIQSVSGSFELVSTRFTKYVVN